METLYKCGKPAHCAALMLLDDGRMVIRDDVGLQVFVHPSFTPQSAIETLRDIYLFAKEYLLDEYSWNEMEKEKAASQDRKANYRDEEYLTFCSSIQKLLVQ